MDMMINERIQYRFQEHAAAPEEQLSMNEYAVALEFYLQIDGKGLTDWYDTLVLCSLVDLFYMKTCSFRGAQPQPRSHSALFCVDEPVARYGMIECRQRPCQFCFPCEKIIAVRRREEHCEPVVCFSSRQTHRFVSGYEAILNCPTVR